jgi:Icc-related predicted phosphoesterase
MAAMTSCMFATDIHGSVDRFEKLFARIIAERPDAVFLGGDILPSPLLALGATPPDYEDFLRDFLGERLSMVRTRLGSDYPRIFVILGNDDGRSEEQAVRELASGGLWEYVHGASSNLGSYTVYGYSFVPPTPFMLKDWERYDVSRYVDPGCIAPEDGSLSVPVPDGRRRFSTIAEDLEELVGEDDMEAAVLLFHSPPYRTALDRAALDGRKVDGVPMDVHVGSMAIARFISERQPLLTLHGHVHESCRITGAWREQKGRTWMISAAHDGPELALVRFDLEDPGGAERELI